MQITEFTDAMCSWAWGTEPKLRLLRWRFEDQLDEWRIVMGHLVEDEHMPERDPAEAAPKLEQYWKVVCDQTGMPRPAPLHRATQGSRSSGLAVKAAQANPDTALRLPERVLRRMREATFVHGQPPDSPDWALAACDGLDGLDAKTLAAQMAATNVIEAYRADENETRQPNDFVLTLEGDRPGIGRARQARDGRMRFVFPTIVIRSDAGEWTVPGWMPYDEYEAALFAAGADETDRTRSKPTSAEAFDRWATLSDTELAFLCGPNASLPAGVASHSYAGGTLHHRTDEPLPLR